MPIQYEAIKTPKDALLVIESTADSLFLLRTRLGKIASIVPDIHKKDAHEHFEKLLLSWTEGQLPAISSDLTAVYKTQKNDLLEKHAIEHRKQLRILAFAKGYELPERSEAFNLSEIQKKLGDRGLKHTLHVTLTDPSAIQTSVTQFVSSFI